LQENFVANTGWLNKWKARHSIRQLYVCGEKKCADTDAANKFKITLSQKIKDETISLSQIFNVDETGLYFKMLPTKTLAGKEECEAFGFKQSKERIIIMLCSNADGSLKLPIAVIGKYEKPRAIKNILYILPVYYTHQRSAWMNNDIFESWFKNEFIPQVTSFLQKRNLPLKALLLLDNASCHSSIKNLQINDITAYYLPPNTTALIQPLDQGIIENVKRRYRAKLLSSVISEQKRNNDIITYLKTISIKDVIYWINEAWNEITANTIFKCWRNIL